jgi:hypothetical protein
MKVFLLYKQAAINLLHSLLLPTVLYAQTGTGHTTTFPCLSPWSLPERRLPIVSTDGSLPTSVVTLPQRGDDRTAGRPAR